MTFTRALRPSAPVSIALFLVAPLMAGCDSLLEVDNPASLSSDDLNATSMLGAIANTSEGIFSTAYNGVIRAAGDIADETDNIYRGSVGTSGLLGFTHGAAANDGGYNSLSQARWVIDDMIGRLQTRLPSPNSDVRLADAWLWGGLTRLALAEYYEEVTFDGGTPVKPDSVMMAALTYFDRSALIAQAAGDVNLRAAALSSKARTYRALYFERGIEVGKPGDIAYFQQAKAAAEQALAAKPDFRKNVRYADPGSQNTFRNLYSPLTGPIMHPDYGTIMDPVSGVAEPRIQHGPAAFPAPDPLKGFVYAQLKYTTFNDPIPVARWQEARLILAEANLLLGNSAEAVNQINLVRTAAKLPAFTGASAAAIYDQIKYERKVEFWLEGRRWQDHRNYEIVPAKWVDGAKLLGVHRRWPLSPTERDTNPNLNK